MATYAGSIDKSEGQGNQGIRFSVNVGSGGWTAGQPVKADTTAYEAVASTTTSDIILGIAATTNSASDEGALVLGNGCLVQVPYTLTTGSKVGVGTGGTAGTLVDYSTGTCVGVTIKGGTLSSLIRVQIQY